MPPQPSSDGVALVCVIGALLSWGGFSSVRKRSHAPAQVASVWAFVGEAAATLVFLFVVGSLTSPTFVEVFQDQRHSGRAAFITLAGVLVGAGDAVLMTALTHVPASIAVPSVVGTIVVAGTTLSYVIDGNDKPVLLFLGVLMATGAVFFTAYTQRLAVRQQQQQQQQQAQAAAEPQLPGRPATDVELAKTSMTGVVPAAPCDKDAAGDSPPGAATAPTPAPITKTVAQLAATPRFPELGDEGGKPSAPAPRALSASRWVVVLVCFAVVMRSVCAATTLPNVPMLSVARLTFRAFLVCCWCPWQHVGRLVHHRPQHPQRRGRAVQRVCLH